MVRCAVQYLFFPKIASKTLQTALTNENHLLGSNPTRILQNKTILENGLKRLIPFGSNSPAYKRKPKPVKRQIQMELNFLVLWKVFNIFISLVCLRFCTYVKILFLFLFVLLNFFHSSHSYQELQCKFSVYNCLFRVFYSCFLSIWRRKSKFLLVPLFQSLWILLKSSKACIDWYTYRL